MGLILVDENIPAAEALLSGFGEVRRFRGRELTAEAVKPADALLVRSVTRVNSDLLEDSRVRFVGSTTIGTDHLDTDWLEQNGIHWCSAPGSNAHSVVDYVLSAVCVLPGLLEKLLGGGRVGIVGYGNVGSRLHHRLAALGIDCLAYDPLLNETQCPISSALPAVLNSPLVCLHTPLTRSGPHPTAGMLSLDDLLVLPQGAVLLNAGRGEVLPNDLLLALLDKRPDIQLVLDVWENEPAISTELLARCTLGTPHIAGYSQDGKWLGVKMVAKALANQWGVLLPQVKPEFLVSAPSVTLKPKQHSSELIRQAVLAAYDVRDDHNRLQRAFQAGKDFDELRRTYPARREISELNVSVEGELPSESRQVLAALRVV
ncbi:erythronate-4-phosphate dehydrogenase [Litorivivens lipolytica]|uniref:Erythronate-4-phosphate dehydrogenase n=1 Tax=Litorivivens lipolytica TaxID=1524264 RepID=A0A7W4W2A7_9GAMM|nr:4-phosphoerythronate dehydrogenase [Litorivivens lipolytica]MBB3046148.1 erythronate-4-phosphate dehydrogenase [Litorivivens lipolytica]